MAEQIVSSWKRGDTGAVGTLTVTDSSGPVDLTGGRWTVAWQLRPAPNASGAVAVAVDESEAAAGVLHGTVPAEVSAAMRVGVWVSDVEVTDTAATPPVVVSSVTFAVEVLADVTRPEVPGA